MNERLELILVACLDALDAGETIDQVLARYPEDAAALRPLIETAAALPALAVEPDPGAQAASRRRFLNLAHERRPAPRGILGLIPLRLGTGLAALAVALLTLGGGAVAAADAIPGDPLYGFKRTVERVELAVTSDRGALVRRLEEERRAEVRRVLSAGRAGTVTFAGTVEQVTDASLRVSGIDLRLADDTRVEGALVVGATAEIAGWAEAGTLTATSVVVDPRSVPPPTATPTPSPSPTATRTPSPTLTPRPTNTATPLPTATMTATREPTATPAPPTRVPPTAPPPTAPPADDNQNDNGGDDNQNDNSGGGDDNRNDNSGGDDNRNDNSGGDDNANDSGGDDNANDSGGGDDNRNDNSGGDDNANDSGGGGDDSGGGDDNGNDDSGGGGDDRGGGGGDD